MAELTPKERLQPSLLDRLIDDHPDQRQEAREDRVLSMRELRRCVLRDLTWLFNCGNLHGVQDLSEHTMATHSVVNFGVPDLTGRAVASMTPKDLETVIRQAILDFEPRILANSVRVRAVVAHDLMNRNTVAFEIEGELWGQPMPTRLFVRTEIDLDTGHVALQGEQTLAGS